MAATRAADNRNETAPPPPLAMAALPAKEPLAGVMLSGQRQQLALH
jgi:hypothetical protein